MLERGLSKAEVARELGISRRTVYHWIGTGQRDRELDEASARYGPHPPVARKIGDPTLRGDPRGGLCGRVHPGQGLRAPGSAAPPADAIVRFETSPGQQAQADFAEWLDITDVGNPKKRSKLEALQAIFVCNTFTSRETATRFALRYGERMVLGMLSRFKP